jgi:hypothetical protein
MGATVTLTNDVKLWKIVFGLKKEPATNSKKDLERKSKTRKKGSLQSKAPKDKKRHRGKKGARNHVGCHLDFTAGRPGSGWGVSIWFGFIWHVQKEEQSAIRTEQILCGAGRSA